MDNNTAIMPLHTSLFQVYLRLKPPQQNTAKQQEQWLVVESSSETTSPTHLTLVPPNESRKRAIERFGFTKIFQQEASQLELFDESGTVDCIREILTTGRDGLVATLGVTGSGKSHTILGSRNQRGLTQMSLDVLFRSIGQNIRRLDHADLSSNTNLLQALRACDPSEAHIQSATSFLESVYGENERGGHSRAQTPMVGGGSRAQTPMTEPNATYQPHRRQPLPRPSALPQIPDVSSYASTVSPYTEYVVLVSMYEVYNDRIFDLLSQPSAAAHIQPMTTRAGSALQKSLMRRPLLFKNTEMSPDRKVVAGLHKIVCGSYEEAMMVLETGLIERRVAGTGSNSVSSRSHGFFCVEVKRKSYSQGYRSYVTDRWDGGTLSIVDLAGSERARNAKTTGSTLAEAGKINESLMYLGQCLQVQSDCQQDGSRPIVPFRQCKLTELLFSNSFPSKDVVTSYRTPQKAIMIVTADPEGDFNATSQILRYSALAREVTVPRIPSVASAILGNGQNANARGRTTPTESPFSAEELEQAANEISRLGEECDALSIRIAEEEIKRNEAELRLQAAEERALLAEYEIREECWNEMETRLMEEKERWRNAWNEEQMHGQQYLDGKIEIIEQSTSGTFTIHEDVTLKERAEAAERENEVLRARVQSLERELNQRSPSKQHRSTSKPNVLQDITASNVDVGTNPFLASLRPKQSSEKEQNISDVSPRKLSLRSSSMVFDASGPDDGKETQEPKTPATVGKKKQRKLTTRKWDLGDPDELGF